MADSNSATFDVVGPKEAKYGFRTKAGEPAACNQIPGRVDPRPLSGLPSSSVQHVAVTCTGLGKSATGGMLLVKVEFDGFSYDFEVPATAAT